MKTKKVKIKEKKTFLRESKKMIKEKQLLNCYNYTMQGDSLNFNNLMKTDLFLNTNIWTSKRTL